MAMISSKQEGRKEEGAGPLSIDDLLSSARELERITGEYTMMAKDFGRGVDEFLGSYGNQQALYAKSAELSRQLGELHSKRIALQHAYMPRQ